MRRVNLLDIRYLIISSIFLYLFVFVFVFVLTMFLENPVYAADRQISQLALVDEDLVVTPWVFSANNAKIEPGILPGNPLHIVDRLAEEFSLALTFYDWAKARGLADQAAERLAEAKELLESDNPQLALGAISTYIQKISAAQKKINMAMSKTDDDTTWAVAAEITQETTHNLQVLKVMLKKLPPKSRNNAIHTIAEKLTIQIQMVDNFN